MKYPVFTPSITEGDIHTAAQCLREGWVSSSGPYVTQFEQAFAQYIGTDYATTVSNGTAALEVALAGLGITSGEVILPAFTIASCAYAILRVGATPIFVDIESDFYCLDPLQVERRITPATKAIMLVNMFGNTVDVPAFMEIKGKYNIPIVEDCSENMGGSYMTNKSGSQFDVSTFSLYANKTITSGEGGVVCSSDSSVIERCNRYKNLDFPIDRRFVHEHQAYNFRMASPLAALAYNQLCRIDEILETKQKIYEMYVTAIDTTYLHPLKPRPASVFVPWMNCFKVSPNIAFDYASFECYMRSFEIQIRPFFSNLARQRAFVNKYNKVDSYPITDNASACGFYLPSGLSLESDDIFFISDVANRYFQ